jgi:hypothetical protein
MLTAKLAARTAPTRTALASSLLDGLTTILIRRISTTFAKKAIAAICSQFGFGHHASSSFYH